MSELLSTFQSFRQILCICPHCNQMMRLSDLHLRHVGKAPKTWLDKHQSNDLTLQKKVEKFEEKENQIREESIERGRKKVPTLVKKCLCPEFRALKYDPYDIKALMHPIDFIVFDGLNAEELRRITFLSRKITNPQQQAIIKSIGETIHKKSYEWKVSRIDMNGKVEFE